MKNGIMCKIIVTNYEGLYSYVMDIDDNIDVRIVESGILHLINQKKNETKETK